jgi:site-specific recombinase XerD
LEPIYIRTTPHARHMSERLFQEREQYLAHLRQQGFSPHRIRLQASRLLHVVRALDLSELRPVSLAELDEASQRWVTDPSLRGIRKGPGKEAAASFLRTAKKWLAFHGQLVTPSAWCPPFHQLIVQFTASLKTQKSYASSSIRAYRWHTRAFLTWFFERHSSLSSVSLTDIDEYSAWQRNRGWTPTSLGNAFGALRAFFEHAAINGWCQPQIAKGIVRPARFRGPSLLAQLSWKDVRRFLTSTESENDPRLIRVHAISLLFSIYGLRASEVARLSLNDFDWRNETLTVTRSKNGRVQQFPIQCEVGGAIIKYLQKSRPRSSSRNLFLTWRPPHVPLGAASYWQLIGPRIRRMQLATVRCGPHILRHACATQLLKKGFSLRAIADFLGHRNINSVSTYAKCDVRSFRKVADFSMAWVTR